MLVRCVRLLQGGRRGGRDVTAERGAQIVEVGREYVVLGIHAQAEMGVTYAILREDIYPALAPARLTSEMFEIVNPTVSSSWIAFDPYGDGKVIDFKPKAWTEPRDFFERKVNGDGSLIPAFVAEVERMYVEEGLEPPVPQLGE
jgi:hypothetical protein